MPIKEYPRTVCRIPLRYRVCPRQEKESLEEPDLEWELRLDPQAAPGSMQGGVQGGMHEGLRQVHRKALERVEKARWSWEC